MFRQGRPSSYDLGQVWGQAMGVNLRLHESKYESTDFGTNTHPLRHCRKCLIHKRFTNAPGKIRTCDPRFRKPMLYPTELRARLS